MDVFIINSALQRRLSLKTLSILIISFSAIFASVKMMDKPENYKLTINGKDYNLALDHKKEITLPDGNKYSVTLTLKDMIEYQSKFTSFNHRNIYQPSKTKLDEGLDQITLFTAKGTLVLIQEYSNVDPSFVIDLMIKETTKEEIQYGYKYKEKNVTKKIGKYTLKGKQAITSLDQDAYQREYYALGYKGGGLFIMTQIIKDSDYHKEKHLIDDFWNTLKFK